LADAHDTPTTSAPPVADPVGARPSFRHDVATPLAVGLLVRLAWIVVCRNEPTSDQFIYHESARFFVERLGYVDVAGNPAGYWPVGYVVLLAPFYAVLGASPTVAAFLNLLLGGATIVTTWGLTRTLFGAGAARAAAWLVALLPTFVLYTTCIASENAVLPGLMGAVWLMAIPTGTTNPEERRRIYLDAGAGILLALTTYVRGTALPFVLIPLALGVRNLRRGVVRAAFVGACVFLLTLPWGLRNKQHFGTFSLTSINAGANLWMGNHEGSDGMAADLPPGLPPELGPRDAELRARAVDYIKRHPLDALQLGIRRVWVTMRSDTIAASWNEIGLLKRFGSRSVTVAKAVCTLGYYSLLGAALLGVWRRRRRRELDAGDLTLLLAIGLAAVPFVLIVGGNRYQMPMQPFLAAWAGAWLAGRWSFLGQELSRPTGQR
jgi:4-amino-4-deoxy-L-arabinose transferase-like glycosyltransferase